MRYSKLSNLTVLKLLKPEAIRATDEDLWQGLNMQKSIEANFCARGTCILGRYLLLASTSTLRPTISSVLIKARPTLRCCHSLADTYTAYSQQQPSHPTT